MLELEGKDHVRGATALPGLSPAGGLLPAARHPGQMAEPPRWRG